MDAKVSELVKNVNDLVGSYRARDETFRELLILILQHLKDPRHQPDRRKLLIEMLEQYVARQNPPV